MSPNDGAALPPVISTPSNAMESDRRQDPNRTLGIIGFVLSFFAIVNVAALIISVIAIVESRKAGFRNRFAVAGTIISSIGIVITIVVASLAIGTVVGAAQTCARLGEGVHVIGAATYTCTPTSFYVQFGTPPASIASDAAWTQAASLYAEAVCPTNEARGALEVALRSDDFESLVPVAASASTDFDKASDIFLENTWPLEIADDVRFLGETSEQLAESWGAVADATNIDEASAIAFPDAQTPFEAAQRIRLAFSQHGVALPPC